MKKKTFILAQYIFPQALLSRLAGYLMESRCRHWKNWMIPRFIKHYHVNMSEAIITDPLAYPSFNEFFIRQLRPECRPINNDPHSIVSPADGVISQIGDIKSGRVIQAKGMDFTVTELLGGDKQLATVFNQGKFTTIYLAPKDYHRVHMPLTGTLQKMIYIPGKLFSVNDTTAQTVPRLFARNERVACLFQTDQGPMAVILVGAFFVASIVTTWAGLVAPNRNNKIIETDYTNKAITLNKGDEIGYFKLGSTAIVLFPEHTIEWDQILQAGSMVKMGQQIGRIKDSNN